MPGLPRWLRDVQPELAQLEAQIDRNRLRDVLDRHLPWIDVSCFEACLAALRPGFPGWRRALVKRAMHRRLRAQARRPPLGLRLATLHGRLRTLGGVLAGPPSHKYIAGGGKIVALAGGDGAGKTTCATALHAWLSKDFATMRAHLGRPPKTLATLAVGAAIRVAGWFKWLGSSPLEQYLELLYHLATARDRYRLYLKVRRFTARQGLAICERYPVPENHQFVGPRIEELVGSVPYPRLAAFLARAERRYYDRIGPDSLLVVLRVDPETAVRRKTTEPGDYVRGRAQAVWDTDWSQTRARVVDANRPLPDVVADLKRIIWTAL